MATARERRIFLTFPWQIYRNDPLWVPPLLPERAKTIDPKRGTFFRRGTADFYLAWLHGRAVGSVCASEDPPTNAIRGTQECIFGFFEYIRDYAVFEALLEQVITWARQRGLTSLRGPFSLDYEDSYGVLIEGRDRPPALMCGHTPPYYQEFMERYGFEPARGDNLAYAAYPDLPGQKKLAAVAAKLRRRGRITVRGADFYHWREEIDRIHRLLEICLAHLPDYGGWQRDSLETMVRPFRRIADPEMILFAEVAGETVGWLPGIPNLNEVFIRINGLRRPWDYVTLWQGMRRSTDSLTVKSILVLPEYWNTGVAIVLLDEMMQRALARGYKWADLSLTSDDNPNTPLLAQHLGAQVYKRYRVYRMSI
jgi:GNAT superfamily N-acetyltransferase